MQVQLGSSSSQLQYAPCRGCDPGTGFAAYLDFYARAGNGTDAGMVTTGSNTSVGLNFTGTGVAFELSFLDGSSDAAKNGWVTDLRVNGSALPLTANATNTSVSSLPYGRHEVTLGFTQPQANSSNPVTVHGVVGTLGQVAGPQSANATIDDSWWRNASLWISGGWNMVEGGDGGQSNYINQTQYDAETGTVANDYNSSVSWTTDARAWNAVRWNGSAVWVYGIAGGDAGTFELHLDNVSQGVFDASGGPRVYDSVLFHASGLNDGPHEVVLTNVAGRLSFDRLVASTGLDPAPVLAPVTSTSSALPSSSAEQSSSSSESPAPSNTDESDPYGDWHDTKGSGRGVTSGTVAGIVIAVLLLLALAFLLCRRRHKREQRHNSKQQWDEDRPWHQRLFAKDKGWRFVHLADAPAMHADAGAARDKDALHFSSSSFGSAAGHLANLPETSPRRSIAGFFRTKSFRSNRSVKYDAEAPLPPLPRGASASPDSDSGSGQHHHLDEKAYAHGLQREMSHPHGMAREPSPNPLYAALGGQHSPLTQLQRSFSTSSGDRAAPPPAIKVYRSQTPDDDDQEEFGVLDLRQHRSENEARQHPSQHLSYTKARDSAYNASIRESAYGNHRNRHTANSGPLGVREWYDWFGLSTYGDRASKQSARNADPWVVDGGAAPVSYVPPVEAQRSPRRRYFDKPSFLHRFG